MTFPPTTKTSDETTPSVLTPEERRDLTDLWGREPHLTSDERARVAALERRMTRPDPDSQGR